MRELTYNRSDWSGVEETVVIKARSFKVKNSDFNGTYKIIEEDGVGSYAKVTVKDGKDSIETITVYNLENNCWYAEFCDTSRESNNPIVTALQTIHNTY
jgi:hypothetical protein